LDTPAVAAAGDVGGTDVVGDGDPVGEVDGAGDVLGVGWADADGLGVARTVGLGGGGAGTAGLVVGGFWRGAGRAAWCVLWPGCGLAVGGVAPPASAA
jgi:hypothetical protein